MQQRLYWHLMNYMIMTTFYIYFQNQTGNNDWEWEKEAILRARKFKKVIVRRSCILKQECIPVGCVPFAAVAVCWRGVSASVHAGIHNPRLGLDTPPSLGLDTPPGQIAPPPPPWTDRHL